MNAPQSQCSTGTALERAARLADEVAAVWADEVDAEARFRVKLSTPCEANGCCP